MPPSAAIAFKVNINLHILRRIVNICIIHLNMPIYTMYIYIQTLKYYSNLKLCSSLTLYRVSFLKQISLLPNLN